MKSLDLSQQECRVPLVPIPPESEKRVKELGGDLMNLYRVIGHNPKLLAGWIEFAYSLRRDCTTSRVLRELMILRGAQICHSAYEWSQHLRMGRKAGVSERQIQDLQFWRESPNYSPPERAALAFMESMMACDTSDEVFDELKKHFMSSEIIELAFTAAFYAMVPRFLNAMRVPIEPADMFDKPAASG
jgi:alkylhydroperoxidase family enzyme